MPLQITDAFNELRKQSTHTAPKFMIHIDSTESVWQDIAERSVIPDYYQLQYDIIDLTINMDYSSEDQINVASASVTLDDSDGKFLIASKYVSPYRATVWVYYGEYEQIVDDLKNNRKADIREYGLELIEGRPLTPYEYDHSTNIVSFDVQVQMGTQPVVKDQGFCYSDISKTIVTGSEWWTESSSQEIPITVGNVRKSPAFPVTQTEVGTCLTNWKRVTVSDFQKMETLAQEWHASSAYEDPYTYTDNAIFWNLNDLIGPGDLREIKHPGTTNAGQRHPDLIREDMRDLVREHPRCIRLFEAILELQPNFYIQTLNSLWSSLLPVRVLTYPFEPASNWTYDSIGYLAEVGMITGRTEELVFPTEIEPPEDLAVLEAEVNSFTPVKHWSVDFSGRQYSNPPSYGSTFTGAYLISNKDTSGNLIYNEQESSDAYMTTADKEGFFLALMEAAEQVDYPTELEIRRSNIPTRTIQILGRNFADANIDYMCIDINKTPDFVYVGGYKFGVELTGVKGNFGGDLYKITSRLSIFAETQENVASGSKVYHENRFSVQILSWYQVRFLKYYAFRTSKGVRTLTEIDKDAGYVTYLGNATRISRNISCDMIAVDTLKMELSNDEQWDPTIYFDATNPTLIDVAQEVDDFDDENNISSNGDSVPVALEGTLYPSNIPNALDRLLKLTDYESVLPDGTRYEGRVYNFGGFDNWYPYDWANDQVYFTYRIGEWGTNQIGELAMQGRIAIWKRFNRHTLKYLGKEPDYFKFTPTETDVITIDYSNCIGEPTTSNIPVEELANDFIFKWKEDLVVEGDANEIEISVAQYKDINYASDKAETFNFWALHSQHLVHKSAVFWAIRKGLPWVTVHVTVPLTFINIDVFDTVKLNLPRHLHGLTALKGEIQSVSINSNTFSIDLEVWVPLVLGNYVPYAWAWPNANGDEDDFSQILRGSGSVSGA